MKIYIVQHKQIVSCVDCKGVGLREREELSCYHKREYDTYTDPCKKCGSEGRVTRTTTKIRVDPKYPYNSEDVVKTISDVPYSTDPITSVSETTINDYRNIKLGT